MSVTAAMVNELRKATGAGLMDCKKALTETSGDHEKAIDYLTIPLTKARMGRRNTHIAVRVEAPLTASARQAVQRIP